MANKHTERCSTSLVTMKMQDKAQGRLYHTPTGRAKVKSHLIPSGDQDLGRPGLADTASENVNPCDHIGKYFGSTYWSKAQSFHVTRNSIPRHSGRMGAFPPKDLYKNVRHNLQ
jgi:hypothetical protein